jgi:hypothetical protein
MKPLRTLAAAAVLTLSTSNAYALGQLVNIEIVDRASNRALPVHWHDGQAWVAGTPGAKYSIRLRNSTWGRVLAIVSVDGVNVLNGQTASAGSASGGYVFTRWQAGVIDGWRKSQEEVAAFHFVESPRSYAARTGRPDHVGVIGVALYREQSRARHHEASPSVSEPHPVPAPAARAQAAPSAGALAQAAPQSATPSSARTDADSHARSAEPEAAKRLGTGHGQREYSPTQSTTFTAATSAPAEVIRIRYDSRENLIAMGVIREPFAQGWGAPNAFPRDGFVPDPPTHR